jgi:hypothetical protein
MLITHASHLDNAALTAELSRLAHCEREATAALIVHLAEFDARRLFEGAGYSSLFKYCMAVLHLSEDASGDVVRDARAHDAGRVGVLGTGPGTSTRRDN